MSDFPRGSEWRKWDLHIHPPGTRLSDGYKPLDWDRFCETIESSEVAVFGVADYFCFDGYRALRREHGSRFSLDPPLKYSRAVETDSESL